MSNFSRKPKQPSPDVLKIRRTSKERNSRRYLLKIRTLNNSSNSPLNPPSTSYRYVSDVSKLKNSLIYINEQDHCQSSSSRTHNFFLRTFRNFDRSSHRRCSKKSVVKKFIKFTGKRLCWNLFTTKVADVWCLTGFCTCHCIVSQCFNFNRLAISCLARRILRIPSLSVAQLFPNFGWR